MRAIILPVLLGLLVLAVDQLTKQYFMRVVTVEAMQQGGIAVMPFFNLVRVWNYGAAFGLGNKAPLLITVITCIAILALCVWLYKNPIRREKLVLAIIIGGAIGNFIDRLKYGAVFDFLDVYYNTYHWPAFNVADIAISGGVGVLLLFSLWPKKQHEDDTNN